MSDKGLRTQRAAIDVRELLARLDNDRESLQEIVEIAREDLPKLATELRGAIAAGDSSGSAAHAHALKGMLSNLGARHAAGSAARIEHFAKQGDILQAAGLLGEFEAEAAVVIPELELYLAEVW